MYCPARAAPGRLAASASHASSRSCVKIVACGNPAGPPGRQNGPPASPLPAGATAIRTLIEKESMAYTEITMRLFTAVLMGCILGLDRNLHGKPTGVKTLGLVALGSALVTIAIDYPEAAQVRNVDALSRVIQGVITGIGFLGAGVIVRGQSGDSVKGLTTAASIWVTAAIGVVCGIGAWRTALIALAIVIALLIVGHPLERYLHRVWLGKSVQERKDDVRHDA
jgi:putative Mg2+ transporter-C (MgtC) family protein